MKIAMCCTRNWYVYLAVDLYALLKHNDIKKIYLFIEDDNIPYLQDTRIKFINIHKQPEYITKQSPNYNTRYGQMSYVRCYFSKIIKENKILYIDTDAIVTDNIQELWDINIKDMAIAGVKEPGKWDRHLKIEGMDDNYINSGVMLMNLKYIREHKLDNEMIERLNTTYYEYPDQDVINIVCKGKIKHIDSEYNSTETTGIIYNAKIVHYIRERKGWKRESPRSGIWFKYLQEMLQKTDRSKYIMIKCEVIEGFSYSKIGDFKNITRLKETTEPNTLHKGDTFECSVELAKFFLNETPNPEHRAFIKVIEVIPGGE